MKHFNKLVRDRIPEIIRADGKNPVTHIITEDQEYLEKLYEKDIEESEELRQNPSLEELVDKLEVLLAIGKVLGFSPEDIEQARLKKADERGAFNKRIFLERTD